MTSTVVISLVGAALAFYAAALSARLARAPGWQEERWHAAASLLVGLFVAANLVTSGDYGVSRRDVLLAAHFQLFTVCLQGAAWVRYGAARLGGTRRADHVLILALLAIAMLTLVPGLAFGTGLRVVRYPELDLLYRIPETRLIGDAAMLLFLLALGRLAFRFAGAARRGMPQARAYALSMGLLVVLAAHDMAIVALGVESFFLTDFALLFPVAIIGYARHGRFVAEARAVAERQDNLEAEVAARTAELTRAQVQLHEQERLAELGRFASRVAHEITNPAAALSANVTWLRAELEARGAAAELVETADDAVAAVGRIRQLARELSDESLRIEGGGGEATTRRGDG